MPPKRKRNDENALTADDINLITSKHLADLDAAIVSKDLPRVARMIILSGELASNPDIGASIMSSTEELISKGKGLLNEWKSGLSVGDLFETYDPSGRTGPRKVEMLKILRKEDKNVNRVFVHYQVRQVSSRYISIICFFKEKNCLPLCYWSQNLTRKTSNDDSLTP